MFTRMVTFMTHKLTHDRGSTSVEYTLVMLGTAIALVLALVAGFNGLLDDVPDAIVSALP